MTSITHRFQPLLEMDDEWRIVDAVDHERTSRTFSRDTALVFCFELERDSTRRDDVATWEAWPNV